MSINISNRRIIYTQALASGGFTATSSQSAAFLARATGITSNTDKTNYDTMITGLVNDGVWSLLDALYILAAPDVATAKLNLVSSSFTITSHGTNIDTTGFTAYSGFTGNGSDRYLDTGCAPSAGTLNYQRDACSYGAYVLSNTAGSNSVEIGANDGAATIADLLSRQAGGNILMRVNNTSGVNVTNATRAGMYVGTRTSTSNVPVYKNGNTTPIGTDTNGSQIITSLPSFFILARDDSGTASSFSSEQLSAAFIGGAQTATNASNLSSRINTFMTAYGINVY